MRELLLPPPPPTAESFSTLAAELERMQKLFAEANLQDGALASLASRFEAFTKQWQHASAAASVSPTQSSVDDEASLFASADDEQLFQLVEQSMGK
jgi:hypothetical protein